MYFQDIILNLQNFWIQNGCILLQPYDIEVGAGTLHMFTALYTLTKNPWNIVYVQPSRRPVDSRYGDNPNRFQHYYQMQVVMKPSPINIQELCLQSIELLGINRKKNDLRFIEDDWENPTIGASGLGYEVWCNGMEILQFTYMQQLGGRNIHPIPVEVTYGLERLAMYIQNVDDFCNIKWNQNMTYKDIFYESEVENSRYNLELANVDILYSKFNLYIAEAKSLLQNNSVIPSYEQCIKASHIFNILESRGAFSVSERANYIFKIRNVVRECSDMWYNMHQNIHQKVL